MKKIKKIYNILLTYLYIYVERERERERERGVLLFTNKYTSTFQNEGGERYLISSPLGDYL